MAFCRKKSYLKQKAARFKAGNTPWNKGLKMEREMTTTASYKRLTREDFGRTITSEDRGQFISSAEQAAAQEKTVMLLRPMKEQELPLEGFMETLTSVAVGVADGKFYNHVDKKDSQHTLTTSHETLNGYCKDNTMAALGLCRASTIINRQKPVSLIRITRSGKNSRT